MKTLGLRHLALNVQDAQRSKAFYTSHFGMSCEWEPDAKNVYLTSSGHDNLALHEVPELKIDAKNQALDHLGFIALTPADVDEFYKNCVANGVEIVAPPKLHRDGAYSCYIKDPDGYVVQMIHHPPIANRES